MKNKIKLTTFALLVFLSLSCGKEKVVVTELNTEFQLNFNQSAEIENENLSIKFQQVNDSRCPNGTNCFWQGEGKVTLKVNSTPFTLSTLNSSKDTLGYTFTLLGLDPYPDISKSIKDEDCVLKMKVTK